jgi:transcription antitermination factor NusG
MSGSYAICGQTMGFDLSTTETDESAPHQWFAIQTRYRFEKKVASQLRAKGCEIYLPLRNECHMWSDRQKNVTVPLFPGYAFVQMDWSAAERRRVLETAGLVGFVSFGTVVAPIPRRQIEDLQLLLKENTAFALHPFVRAGQRVRVRGGSLHGLEGIVLDCNKKKLIISIDTIQRSLAIEIRGYELELI